MRVTPATEPPKTRVKERLSPLRAFPPCLSSRNSDRPGRREILNGLGPTPAGLIVDVTRGHVYWTNIRARFGASGDHVEQPTSTAKTTSTSSSTPMQIESDPLANRLV